jgi:antitoxin YefM
MSRLNFTKAPFSCPLEARGLAGGSPPHSAWALPKMEEDLQCRQAEQKAATGEAVIIKRRGAEGMASAAAAELRSVMETAHLLRSPKNAERLLRALRRAKGRTTKPSTVADLRKDLGVEG